MKTFYKELLRQGKDVKWLAKQVGVSTQAVYDWKSGKSKPKPVMMLKVGEILKIKTDLLIEDFYSKNSTS